MKLVEDKIVVRVIFHYTIYLTNNGRLGPSLFYLSSKMPDKYQRMKLFLSFVF